MSYIVEGLDGWEPPVLDAEPVPGTDGRKWLVTRIAPDGAHETRIEDGAPLTRAMAIARRMAELETRVPTFGKANSARKDRAAVRRLEARRLRDRGLDNAAIARQLEVSPRQVSNYLRPEKRS